jgi:hypothetical protein
MIFLYLLPLFLLPSLLPKSAFNIAPSQTSPKKGFQQIAEIFLPDDAFLCILCFFHERCCCYTLFFLLCVHRKWTQKIVVTLNIEKWTNLHLLSSIPLSYLCVLILEVNYKIYLTIF